MTLLTKILGAVALSMIGAGAWTLEGTVLDGANAKAPLNGVDVSLIVHKKSAITDAQGLFRLSGTEIIQSAQVGVKGLSIQAEGLRLQLNGPTDVHLTALNVLGSQIAEFRQVLGAGRHDLKFRDLAPSIEQGISLWVLRVGSETQVIQVTHLGTSSQVKPLRTEMGVSAVIDTLVVSKSGYKTLRVPLTSLDQTVPDVTLNPAFTNVVRAGYLFNTKPSVLAGVNWSNYTHILYFPGIGPQDDGSIYRYQTYGNVRLWSVDTNLIASAPLIRAAGNKILVTIGGSGNISELFDGICKTAERANFVDQVVELMDGTVGFAFDGVNLEWVTPLNLQKGKCLTEAIKAIRAKMPQGKLLTASVVPDSTEMQFYDPVGLNQLDWVGLMTYDYGGTATSSNHSSLQRVTQDIKNWVNYGIQPAKLLMGMPLYGTVTNYGASKGLILGYKYEYSFALSDWAKYSILFDTPEELKAKVDYIGQNDHGGIMYWEVTQDDQGSQSLALKVKTQMQGVPSSSSTAQSSSSGVSSSISSSSSGMSSTGNLSSIGTSSSSF